MCDAADAEKADVSTLNLYSMQYHGVMASTMNHLAEYKESYYSTALHHLYWC